MAVAVGRHLPRRTVLRGLGVAVALPWLDAMVPVAARSRAASAIRQPPRLVCIEMVHGAAGSSQWGAAQHLWSPAATGRDFDLAPTSLRSLEPFRDHLTIVSNTDVPNAEPFTAREIGGDHFRSSAVFLTQAHPRQTQGADVRAGVSLDQLYAQRFGQDTALPSVQLGIEPADQGGSCAYGYSCAYMDSISWASPSRPLPMLRDPRMVFDALFGDRVGGASPAVLAARRAENRSILDWVAESATRLRGTLGPTDRRRLDDYLENVREIERRIQNVEAANASGEPRALPEAPAGVPDSFTAHVQLMFDLLLVAFESNLTRVCAFKMGRDNSVRTFPDSGFTGPFHPTSHHGGKPDRIRQFATINAYHVGLVASFIARLAGTPGIAGSLLDETLLLYGSAMGDPNLHNHRNVPFFIAGRANGALRGGHHLRAPRNTSLANVMLSVLHALGMDDIERFGDSTEPFALS